MGHADGTASHGTGRGGTLPAVSDEKLPIKMLNDRVLVRIPEKDGAEVGDRVLFSPEDRYEVEVGGSDYIMLRERDIHAVAATRIESQTGLYL